jgi:hypothetical protein
MIVPRLVYQELLSRLVERLEYKVCVYHRLLLVETRRYNLVPHPLVQHQAVVVALDELRPNILNLAYVIPSDSHFRRHNLRDEKRHHGGPECGTDEFVLF